MSSSSATVLNKKKLATNSRRPLQPSQKELVEKQTTNVAEDVSVSEEDMVSAYESLFTFPLKCSREELSLFLIRFKHILQVLGGMPAIQGDMTTMELGVLRLQALMRVQAKHGNSWKLYIPGTRCGGRFCSKTLGFCD